MIVLKSFRDRRTGQVLPVGAPFHGAKDLYVTNLLRTGMIGKQAAPAVPPDPTFCDDAEALAGPDSGDSSERSEPEKRKPGRPRGRPRNSSK
jgi:hypothetical protein